MKVMSKSRRPRHYEVHTGQPCSRCGTDLWITVRGHLRCRCKQLLWITRVMSDGVHFKYEQGFELPKGYRGWHQVTQ